MNIRQWLEMPFPTTSPELGQHLENLMKYVASVGDTHAIAELAEVDVLSNNPPSSSNPIYRAAYLTALQFHSVPTSAASDG
jgi:hypothetical protein